MIGIDLITPIITTIGGVINRLVPDKAEAARMQQEITLELLRQDSALQQAAAEIVKAEAESEHWLTACWRPILMLTFGALIVARWLGYSAPNITEAETLKLWSIVELGLGGYVIGRSVEKVVPAIAEVVRK